jgi:chromosome segregation ATPase
MKDKKILILIASAGVLLMVILSVSGCPTKSKTSLSQIRPQEVNIAKLQAQIEQARDLIRAFVEFNISLQKSLDTQRQISEQERVKILGLEQKLKETSAQNETLTNELTQAKEALELTAPIRQELTKINNALAGLGIKPKQEKEILLQLKATNKELDSIDHSIASLLKENLSYKRQAQNLSALLDSKNSELATLIKQQEENRTEMQGLNNRLRHLSEDMKKLNTAKSLLEQKASELEKTVERLKQTNLSLNEKLGMFERNLRQMENKESKIIKEKEKAIRQKEELISKYNQQTDTLTLLIQTNQEMENKLNFLKAELGKLEQLNKEYANLKSEYKNTQATLIQNETELGRRANSILNLQERINELEAKAADSQLKSLELEKECATLREQNVAAQLEKEELGSQLNQAKLRLSDLESQLIQIGNILKPLPPAEASLPQQQEDAKKVEVEIFPQTQNLEVE